MQQIQPKYSCLKHFITLAGCIISQIIISNSYAPKFSPIDEKIIEDEAPPLTQPRLIFFIWLPWAPISFLFVCEEFCSFFPLYFCFFEIFVVKLYIHQHHPYKTNLFTFDEENNTQYRTTKRCLFFMLLCFLTIENKNPYDVSKIMNIHYKMQQSIVFIAKTYWI